MQWTNYIWQTICESINAKLNFNLPKKSTNNLNFIEGISKIIISSKINNKDIKRNDYIISLNQCF